MPNGISQTGFKESAGSVPESRSGLKGSHPTDSADACSTPRVSASLLAASGLGGFGRVRVVGSPEGEVGVDA